MKNEISYSCTLKSNPNQVEMLKKFFNDEKPNRVKNDSSLYEVSMYE